MAAGPLVITEVMYHPAGSSAAEQVAGWSEADFEFIELQNVGDQNLALEGHVLSKGVSYTFAAVQLLPGQRTVVVNNRSASESRHGAGINIAGEYSGSLGNSGDSLRLRDSSDETIVDFDFEQEWYPSTDGGGFSLSLINPLAPLDTWGDPNSWKASLAPGGSPGSENGAIDTSSPSVPQSLSGSPVGSSRVDLNWQASTDAESGINKYQVYRNGVMIGSSTLTTFADLTALPNSSYVYRVTALNGFNVESSFSNGVTVNLTPVGTTPTFAAGQEIGRAVDSGLAEASGIVASRRNPGIFYAHNDGAQSSLVILNSQAAFLGSLTLSGVSSVDWEDIAIGPGPSAGVNYIYIGDIGDNDENRASIKVYRVPESLLNPNGGNQSISLNASQFATITLLFPDGAHDAETLLSDPLTGDLYVISKLDTPSRIYRAAAADLAQGGTVQLSFAGSLNFLTPSAGDISPTGREILIRNEDAASLYLRAEGQTVAQALAGTPIAVPIIGTPTEANGEAIAFDAAGNDYFTISEGNNPRLYFFHRTSQSPGQSNSWHNSAMPQDVNNDGLITALDVLIVVNDLNANGSRTLPQLGTASAPAFLDVNDDDQVSALDVLLIVNHLNSRTTFQVVQAAANESASLAEQTAGTKVSHEEPRLAASELVFSSEGFTHELHAARLDSTDSTISVLSELSKRDRIRSRPRSTPADL